tara:strand:- start:569 stop:865 length:297 start_codon:yes stop_codon:yes gene_type:complete
LFNNLWKDEAHLEPLRSDHDRVGVCRIILFALHERFNVTRRYQLHLMAKLDHFTGPVMGTPAGLHDNHHGRLLRHEPGEIRPRQFPTELWLPRHRGRV